LRYESVKAAAGRSLINPSVDFMFKQRFNELSLWSDKIIAVFDDNRL